jgi:hypothetical protein
MVCNRNHKVLALSPFLPNGASKNLVRWVLMLCCNKALYFQRRISRQWRFLPSFIS